MNAKDEDKFAMYTAIIGAAAIPSRHRAVMQNRLSLANIDVDAYRLYGYSTYVSAILSFIAGIWLGVYFLNGGSIIAMIILGLVLTPVVFALVFLAMRWLLQFIVDTRILNRVSDMEEALPDYLSEVSLNLKAGQSLPQALESAANEDLGEISSIMKNVTTRVNLGYDLEEALDMYLENYPSEIISDSFELILISWRKGTSTPKIIDRIVSNMKIMRNLREKISASVANYRIFLATITVIVAPAMMALSYYVVNLIRSITTQVMQVTVSSAMPFTIQAVQFNDSDFIWFSVLSLIVISSFTAMITRYIQAGTVRGGNRQLLIYLATSLISYGLFFEFFSIFFKLFQV